MQWPTRKQTMTPTTTTARAPIAKWSGSDEPQSYYHEDDEDTGTLTVEEQRRIQWYCASAHIEWHNADED